MYGNIKELMNQAKEKQVPLWRIILDTEVQVSE